MGSNSRSLPGRRDGIERRVAPDAIKLRSLSKCVELKVTSIGVIRFQFRPRNQELQAYLAEK